MAKMGKWKGFFLSSFFLTRNLFIIWKSSTESSKVLADTFYLHFLKGRKYNSPAEEETTKRDHESMDYIELNSEGSK